MISPDTRMWIEVGGVTILVNSLVITIDDPKWYPDHIPVSVTRR